MKRLEWTRDLVEDFWSAISETRLTELNFSKQAGPKLLGFLEPHLNKQWRCLDFGAGDGDFVRNLIEHGYNVAAYEPAEGRREKILRQDYCRSPQFLGVVGPEADTKFDCIFVLDTIEHILDDDLNLVFETIKRFLRQDGLLIVTTPNNEDLELNSVYCPKSGCFFHRWQHVRSFTPDSLDAFLDRFGFVRQYEYRVDFSSNVELLHIIKALKEEIRLRQKYGWFYRFTRIFSRQSENDKVDIRCGADTHLIYLGRAQQA